MLDPLTERVLLELDSELLRRIDRISEETNMERERVVALALMTLIKHLELRDSGKMMIACPIQGTELYRDPLELVMMEGPEAFANVYDQMMRPVESD